MPPKTTQTTPDLKGRQETLSPTSRVPQSVWSAIELTVKDLEPSEQCITDKCGEVNFQLSNHRDWSQPNPQLHQDICDLLPILYQSGFNTEGFPNLEEYLYQTVGSLPYQSLLRLALDSVFRWFKFTLKPPYSIALDNLRLAIWDTSFWTFWLKFGHKGP